MMVNQEKEQSSLLYESLFQQNQALRDELAQVNEANKADFALLVGTTRRLQATSSSIKAAVSSLLNYDILWDASNQHEFLETINISIDLLTHLVTLMALRFRVEAGDLEFNYEKQSLQEIISSMQVRIKKNGSDKPLDVSFTNGGKLVFVDYGYLIASLELLISAISKQNNIQTIRITAEEQPRKWLVSILDLDTDLVQAIQAKNVAKKNFITNTHLFPENILELYTALDLLKMQDIQVELADGSDGKRNLNLFVPVAD